MTDKQIIIYKKECYNEPYCSLNQVLEQLKRKEQECERLKDKLNCCFCNQYVKLNDIEKQRKCVEVTECFRRQLDQLKAENEELKNFHINLVGVKECEIKELARYKQIIEKVREACGVPLCGDDTRSLILEICDEVNDETTNN